MRRMIILFSFVLLSLSNGNLHAQIKGFYPPADTQWEMRYPRIPAETITDIVFTTERSGFFSSSAGSIFKTSDGGNSWHQKIHLPRDLIRQVTFANSQIGFAFSPHSHIGDNQSSNNY